MQINEIDKYLDYFKENRSRQTAYVYRWQIREYFSFLKNHSQDVQEITSPIESIKSYMEFQIAERDWSRSSVDVALHALKWFYEKVMNRTVETQFFLNRGRKTEHKPRILSREEVDRIWEAAAKLENPQATMIHVGWEACLRTGELVPLKGENFLPDGILKVKVLKTKQATKQIGLTSTIFEMVESLISKPRTPVFRRPVKEGYMRRYTPGEWSYWFQQWTETVLDPKGIRWHDFARHTRLTHYAEDTKSFLAVLQLSGHQNPAVCRKYFQMAKVFVPELALVKTVEFFQG
ncbi:Tyrosine recombinase XerC [subsurface metagenome]